MSNNDLQTEDLQSLIKSCIENDRKAQEKLYLLYYSRLMRLVRTYIDCSETAKEVLNNGYLRAFKKLNTFNFKGSFEGWLRKIVFHAVADYKKHNRVLLTEIDGPLEATHNLYFNQLLQLVDKLPLATRNVFHLYVFEGYTHSKIGEILNISVGTSKWHFSEGRRMLKDRVEALKLNIEI